MVFCKVEIHSLRLFRHSIQFLVLFQVLFFPQLVCFLLNIDHVIDLTYGALNFNFKSFINSSKRLFVNERGMILYPFTVVLHQLHQSYGVFHSKTTHSLLV